MASPLPPQTQLQTDLNAQGMQRWNEGYQYMVKAFGPPNAHPSPPLAGGREYLADDKIWRNLWAAWEGDHYQQKDMFLRGVTAKGNELLKLFPIMDYEEASIKYNWTRRGEVVITNEWNFGTGRLEVKGKRTPGTINETTRNARTQGMSHYGNGFTVPLNFMQDPHQKNAYVKFIHQVEENVRQTWAFQVVETMMREARAYLDKRQGQAVSPMEVGARLHYNWDLIGALQKNGKGVVGMEDEVYQNCLSRSVSIDSLLTAAGTAHFLYARRHFTQAENGDMVDPAKRAPHMDTEGGARTALHNLRIFESRRFAGASSEPPVDPMVRRLFVSQRFSMLPRVMEEEFDDSYLSRSRSIAIVDANVFRTEEISLKTALDHSGLFRPAGRGGAGAGGAHMRVQRSTFGHKRRAVAVGPGGGGGGGAHARGQAALFVPNEDLFDDLLKDMGVDKTEQTAQALFRAMGMLDSMVELLQESEPGATPNKKRRVMEALAAEGANGAVAQSIRKLNLLDQLDQTDQQDAAILRVATDETKAIVTAIEAHDNAGLRGGYLDAKRALTAPRGGGGQLTYRLQYARGGGALLPNGQNAPCDPRKDEQSGYVYLPCDSEAVQRLCLEGARAWTYFIHSPLGLNWAMRNSGPPANMELRAFMVARYEIADFSAEAVALGVDDVQALAADRGTDLGEVLRESLGIDLETSRRPLRVETKMYQWARMVRLGDTDLSAWLQLQLAAAVANAGHQGGAAGHGGHGVGAYDPCDFLARIPLTSYKFWTTLITHNIPFPLGFLLFRMHLRLEVGSAIFFKRGEATGVLAIKDAGVTFTRDTSSFALTVGVRMTSGTFINLPENLELMPNVFIKRYLDGGGAALYDPSNGDHRSKYKGSQAPRDIFVVAVPYTHRCTYTFTDVTGNLHAEIREPSDQPHYATAGTYSQFWGWRPNPLELHHDRLGGNHINRLSVCAQSSQLEYNYHTRRCDVAVPGVCALGPSADPRNWRIVLGGDALGYSGSGFEGSRPSPTVVHAS